MPDILQNLNPAQREAVTATEGYIRVIAGAGSGKTRALTHRFAFLVNELGVLPGHILCVTFTNKSANEMRQRIHNLTGDNDTGYIGTFHAFCVTILQEDSHAVGYPRSFLVLDNEDINAMLRIVYEERGLTLRHKTFGQARDMIEIRKLFKEPGYYLDLIDQPAETLRERYLTASEPDDIIFYGYLYQQKKCFGLDYNDLILFTLHIFRQDAAIRQKWQGRLEYIMVDEFQDIDSLQYELMTVLCGYHKNLFIVGDPDQTIYTWRGANVKFLLDFDQQFPGARTIMMNENYRSTPQILSAANSLISKNHARVKKDLIPTLPDGQPVLCRHAENETEQAHWIISQIKALRAEGVPLGDIAILYRAHYVTRALEDAFLTEEIPYTIYSGVQFYDRAEIKDALSYLRMVAYQDDLSFLRVANNPKRNLGQKRMAFLRDAAAVQNCSLYEALRRSLDSETIKGTGAARFVALIDGLSAQRAGMRTSEILSAALDRSGYEAALRTEGDQTRLDNLAELKQSVHAFETGWGEETALEHYLAYAALFTSGDARSKGDAVKLMTVHAAKGLEFPYVFLCSLSEGIFPSRKVRTLQGMEEERRLCFVALTRAEKGLYLSEAEGRNLDGSPRYPSRFLLDVDPALLQYDGDPRESLIEDARNYVETADRFLVDEGAGPRFVPGDRVRHSVFGAGTVLEEDGQQCTIQFDGMETPRKLTLRAKLEKI